MPNLIRTYTSAPVIDFGYLEPRTNVVINNQRETQLKKDKKDILNDLTSETILRGELERGQSTEDLETEIINPFTGESEVSYSKVITRNKRAGETVASSLIVKKIDRQYE